MASSGSLWSWDPHRRDYYYVTRDREGNYAYHYQNQTQYAHPTTASASQYPTVQGDNAASTQQWQSTAADRRPRVDSTTGPTMPDPAPSEVRERHPNLIEGTPDQGWYEGLDASYRMRTGAEIYHFFRIGKVFSMLHIQAASENALRQNPNDTITVVRYGEHAFSQIRRFIVVEIRRGFVYACPITTYSRQGCLKHGCLPSEHSAVYIRGTNATLLQGEYERGLTKKAICIDPADASVQMEGTSRLQYSKPYPIEMNVKVKDIGDVAPEDLSDLMRYYREENGLLPVPG